MDLLNLDFSILTFNHLHKYFTFYFSNKDNNNLCRLNKSMVPDEVVEKLGEQEYYYTSFDTEKEGFLGITKRCEPINHLIINKEGEAEWKTELNSAFSESILCRYYNTQIQSLFQSKGHLVKSDSSNDTEIWLPLKMPDNQYKFFEKYTIRFLLGKTLKKPEFLITYSGTSKVLKKSIADIMPQVSFSCFNWIIYNDELCRYDKLAEKVETDLNNAFPVWDFVLNDALPMETESIDKT